ncbi:MAG TPA: response regulator transcription factor [Puia sp.]|jgi:DNA-binding NarL/FixJ family response regulator
MIKITIVDDNPEVRTEFEKLIEAEEGFEVVGSYGDPQEAIVLIPFIKPDVVLLDIYLGIGESGVDCIRKLKPDYPEIKFMICTLFDDDEKIFEALCAGANGYMLKRTAPAELLRALREVHDGGAPMSGLIARKVVSVFQVNDSGGVGWNPLHAKKGKALPVLSNRENEILHQLALGLLYKEIAANLFISSETVRKHVYHIYEKLHVGNRVEAINKYFRRS